MQVKQAMTPSAVTVTPTATLLEAAQKMREHDVGFLPILDGEDAAVGVITDRDIAVRSVCEGQNPVTTPVTDAMSRDVLSCAVDDDLESASRIMKEKGVRRLLVTDGGRILGILSLGDLATRAPDRGGVALAHIARLQA